MLLSRRQFNAGLAGSLVAMPFADPAHSKGGRRPNVLIIQPDQLRGPALGCAGDPTVQTPNIDRLAREGIRFTNCASSTPACGPFRGSMQTGLYPHRHGVWVNDRPLKRDLSSFAESFVMAGYATGYVGKWHLDGKKGLDRNDDGFIPPDRRFGWSEWQANEKGHSYFEVYGFDEQGQRFRVPDCDWEPEWHTDLALDFIGRHTKAEKPWLFYVSYGPPHLPEECPKRYLDRYPPDELPLTPDLEGRFAPDREKWLRRKLQCYYGQITSIDDQIGRLLEGLRETGADRDTIVLFTSDHGDVLGSHCHEKFGSLRWKNAPYANAFRIPLIVRWPGGVPAGNVCDALVHSPDLPATLLELAGLSVPRAMEGSSMARWCTGGDGPRQPELYLSGYLGWPRRGPWRGLWDGNVVYAPLFYRVLFDHRDDPHEQVNRFDDPSHRGLRAELDDRLLGMARRLEDPAVEQFRNALR